MAIKSSVVAPKAQIRRTFRTGQVMTLAGAHLVHDVFSSFLAPLLPLLIDKLSLSLTAAGSLTMYQRLPSMINPFIGLLADRVDLRWFIIVAPSVTAAAMSLLGLAPSYGVLAVLLLISGLSAALFHVPGPVLVAWVSGRQVGKGMSFWMTAGELARTIGPLFAVFLVAQFTLEGYWPVMTLGFAASVVIYVRIKDVEIRPPAKTKGSLGQTWLAMRHVLLPLMGILVARGFMRGALTTFLPTYVRAEGQSLWFAGMALAVLELAGAAGALAAGTLSDKVGRRKIILATMAAAPFFMFAFLAVEGYVILPILVLLGITILSTAPVILAMIQDHAGDHPATANGLYMGISFVISALIPLLVGVLADLVGLRTAFAWSAVLALLGLPFVFALPRDA